jgi:CO/xanthine dehydrogenase FAD-binding subunit
MKYMRPKTLKEALALLGDGSPLGGGTTLAPERASLAAVLDLRDLALDTFASKGSTVTLGATLTLQGVVEQAGKLPDALIESIQHEVGWNLRNAATVAGTLVAADGRSPFLTTLLALEGVVSLEPGERKMALHEFLPARAGLDEPYLITSLEITLAERLAYAQVARTPMDRPMVCVSAARTAKGAIRLGAGGFGDYPLRLIEAEACVNDGQKMSGLKSAVEKAFQGAGDAFASGAYRAHAAAVLVERLVREVRA